jgi:thiamine biosynthesis lipoprotein ApbE
VTRCAAFALVLIATVSSAPRAHEAMRPVMGTFARIRVVDRHDNADEAAEAALDEIERLDGVMSNYKKDSDLSRLNDTGAGHNVAVSADLYSVLKSSVYFNDITNGAFDVTVAPLVRLWRDAVSIPGKAQVMEVLARVGSRFVVLDEAGGTVHFGSEGVEIDLGAIGKGYAVDRAVELLRGYGITSGVVDLGRTLFCIGKPESYGGWPVAIAHPENRNAFSAKLFLNDMAVSTSGNYENSRTLGGKRIGHILDARTGYPIENALRGVTVVAEDATAADALATSVFVLGIEEGLRLIETMPGTECILFYRDTRGRNRYAISEGFEYDWISPDFSR